MYRVAECSGKGRLLAGALWAVLAAAGFAGEPPRDGSYVEKWPAGTTKVSAFYKDGLLDGSYSEYFEKGGTRLTTAYSKGKLHGPYVEYNENGQRAVQCTYVNGLLEGPYGEFYPSGKPKLIAEYSKGRMNGRCVELSETGQILRDEQVFAPGAVYVRSVEEISKALSAIEGAEPEGPLFEEPPVLQGELKAGKVSRKHLEAALRHLRAYRYLGGVPWENLTLNDQYISAAQHGAALMGVCQQMGHKLAQPAGMPEAFYKLASTGVGSSNLDHGGGMTLRRSIDEYMDDSGSGNIGSVGHRRWCLNPQMAQTGFGICDKYAAMWVFDYGNARAPEVEAIVFPAAGFHPTAYFGAHYAWSAMLNPRRYAMPDKAQLKFTVRRADEKLKPVGEPLAITNQNVDDGGCSWGHCVIFRPEKVEVKPGERYLVEIGGLKMVGGKVARLAYSVEFCEIRKDAPVPK